MIKHILEKPARNERLIEQRMNADDAIFFLNRTENKIFLRPLPAPAAPDHAIAAQAAAEMPFVHVRKNSAKIKAAALMLKMEVPLHRQRRPGQFSLCLFLCHQNFPVHRVERHSILVRLAQTDKNPSLGKVTIYYKQLIIR